MLVEPMIYPRENVIFDDPRLHAREVEQIFDREWLAVGVLSQLPVPESWFTYDDHFGRSILVTRSREGTLHAFFNSCRHRGTRLCTGSGVGRLQCPMHGWVYDTNGRLRGAAHRQGLPKFLDSEHGLHPLEIDTLGGILFVRASSSPNAPSLRSYLGVMAAYIERFTTLCARPIAEYRYELDCDWKIAVSTSVEDYHVPFVHGGSLESYRAADAANQLFDHGHSRSGTPVTPSKIELATMRLLLGGNDKPGQVHNFVFPNLVAIETVLFCSVTLFLPRGVGRSLRVTRLYDCVGSRPKSYALRTLQQVADTVATRVARRVYDEDDRVCREAQRGVRTGRNFKLGPAHLMEARVEHFLAEVARRLDMSYGAQESVANLECAAASPLQAATGA